MQTYLGLDLAWYGSGKTSAVAVLTGDACRVELVRVFEDLEGDDEILSAVEANASSDAALAIDAPLVINNATGQRLCETEIGRRFGHADASAYTSNLVRFPDARSVGLAKRLMDAGWHHDINPASDQRRHGRWFFEVYPHPAHVVLFDLPRILKYKKGPVDLRRAGLTALREAITHHLGAAAPALVQSPVLQELLSRQLDALRGAALKAYEDSLDALLCAFIAAHYWAWGAERNDMIGTMDGGYIVTPNRTVRGLLWSFERARPSNSVAAGDGGNERARVKRAVLLPAAPEPRR